MTIHSKAVLHFPELQLPRVFQAPSVAIDQITILATIPHLHQDWTADEWLWLVEYRGQHYLLVTQEGILQIVPPGEALPQLRDHYTTAIAAIDETLALLQQPTNATATPEQLG